MLIRLDRRPLNGYRSSFSQIFIMRKTHKGIAKRFKITGTDKVKFRKPSKRHLRRKLSTKQVRAGNQDQVLAKGMARRVIKAIL